MAAPADARTLPFSWYSDEAVLRDERARIFARCVAVRRPRRAGRRAGLVSRDRCGRRAGRRHARPRRRAPRVPERLPPPRRGADGGLRQARDAAVPLPRVDVRARRVAPRRRHAPTASPASTATTGRCSPQASARGGRFSSSTPTADAAPLDEHAGELPEILAREHRRRRNRVPLARRVRR